MKSTPAARGVFHRSLAFLVVFSLTLVTTLYAQQPTVYSIEMAVAQGKKSVETDADITFNESTVSIVPDKASMKESAKEFAYSDIKNIDYSFAKKPMLSGGGAVATALLVGFIFALPFLFIKKKRHWAVIQTENDFAVMKLGTNNHRQIIAEFKAKGVTVSELKEEGKD
ncbi:MAG TPA: hypothetical protein PKE66_07185 [Pyrinomonadaceae bacterium]|nr:hypothetical protein [Pyrinomonadaceae bacterium]